MCGCFAVTRMLRFRAQKTASRPPSSSTFAAAAAAAARGGGRPASVLETATRVLGLQQQRASSFSRRQGSTHGPIEPFYEICADDSELRNKLDEVTRYQDAYRLTASGAPGARLIEFLRNAGLWDAIAVRLSFTSNALEGNRLSEKEVHALLRSTVPESGSMSEDQEDILAHARGLERMAILAQPFAAAEAHRASLKPLTTRDLRDLHLVSFPACKYNAPGEWRDGARASMSTAADGSASMLLYPPPFVAAEEIFDLVRWMAKAEGDKSIHPIAVATIAHYNLVRAHPFGDGNGRMGRMLMNLLLLRSNHMPSIIVPEDKQRYLAALHAADHKRTLTPLATLVADGTLRCLKECELR